MPGPMPHDFLLGRRILVVEDDYILAEDLRQELVSLGAEVMGPVPDLVGAMGLLASEPPPDGAILDINLGGEMVFPFADSLSEKRIPFVFATGYEGWAIPEPYASLPRIDKPLDMRLVAQALAG